MTEEQSWAEIHFWDAEQVFGLCLLRFEPSFQKKLYWIKFGWVLHKRSFLLFGDSFSMYRRCAFSSARFMTLV